MTATAWSKPVLAVGDFVVLVGETFAAMFRRPFAWRELLTRSGSWRGVDRPDPGALDSHTVLIVFTLNIVLLEVGAGDPSGAGAALAW